MKIEWDSLCGKVAGWITTFVIIKLLLAPEVGWWEIVEAIIKGLIGW